MSKPAKSKFPETGNVKVTARVNGKDSVRVEGVRKFRQANPRVDFYPTPDAWSAITSLRQQYPAATLREVIDTLILEGIKAFPEK